MLPLRQHPSTSCSKRNTKPVYMLIQPAPGFGLRTREAVHLPCTSVLQSAVVFTLRLDTGSLPYAQKAHISEQNRTFLTTIKPIPGNGEVSLTPGLQSGAPNRKSSTTASAVFTTKPLIF